MAGVMTHCIKWALVAGTLVSTASAQEVFQSARQRTSWVGRPLIVQYIYSNVESPLPPELPPVDGLQYQIHPANTSSQITLSFGQRVERSETTWPVAITADRAGSFTIPAFDLIADEQRFRTEPLTLQFLPSDDDALLQASVEADAQGTWLGDVLDSTLRVRVRPFQHSALPSGRLSAADTWRLIAQGTSDWGPYASTVEHLSQQRRMPPVSSIRDDAGEVIWYIFDVPSTMRPDRAGPVDVADVTIGIDYPLEVGRSRNPLDDLMGRGGLRIVQSRPVTARPEPMLIQVNTPPAEGRPPGWTGAVGRFEFDLSATPASVDVGEPVTLRMTVRDVSERPTDMQTLAAPALEDVSELTADFKVPDDRPGGIVSGRSKTFTQSIRPMRDDIDLIPPVPFSFFDPTSGTWETVFAGPIPLDVHAGRTVGAADLPGMPSVDDLDGGSLKAMHGGLLANISDPDLLLGTPAEPSPAWFFAALLVPPVIFIGAASSRHVARRAASDPARGRARKALRRATEALGEAGNRPDAVAGALRTLVIDRLDLPRGSSIGELTVALRAKQSETADQLQSMLSTLEGLTFGGASASIDEQTRKQVESLMDRITEVTR
ncbi:MAG: BatD family protein [Phycisphaerales bacterium]|nr:BatD family protein [Phycisphaerales bacterium]